MRNDIDWSVLAHSGKKYAPNCQNCKFVGRDGYCNYILKTGRRRPCKPRKQGGCRCKQTSTHQAVSPPPLLPGSRAAKKGARAEQKPIDHEKALELYNKGSSDAHIAVSLNATRMGVLKWRVRHNLPSNFKQGRIRNDQ